MSDTRLILCVVLGAVAVVTALLESAENPVRTLLQGPGGIWRRLRRKRWTALLVAPVLAAATAVLLWFQVYGTMVAIGYGGQLIIYFVAAAPALRFASVLEGTRREGDVLAAPISGGKYADAFLSVFLRASVEAWLGTMLIAVAALAVIYQQLGPAAFNTALTAQMKAALPWHVRLQNEFAEVAPLASLTVQWVAFWAIVRSPRVGWFVALPGASIIVLAAWALGGVTLFHRVALGLWGVGIALYLLCRRHYPEYLRGRLSNGERRVSRDRRPGRNPAAVPRSAGGTLLC